jgi:hypothetical protein
LKPQYPNDLMGFFREARGARYELGGMSYEFEVRSRKTEDGRPKHRALSTEHEDGRTKKNRLKIAFRQLLVLWVNIVSLNYRLLPSIIVLSAY